MEKIWTKEERAKLEREAQEWKKRDHEGALAQSVVDIAKAIEGLSGLPRSECIGILQQAITNPLLVAKIVHTAITGAIGVSSDVDLFSISASEICENIKKAGGPLGDELLAEFLGSTAQSGRMDQ